MSAHRYMEILEEGLRQKLFTSATFGVRYGHDEPWFFTAEQDSVRFRPDLSHPEAPASPPVYDIASVTKFLLAMLVFRLMTDRNRIAQEMFDSGVPGSVSKSELIRNFHPDRLVMEFLPIRGKFSEFLFVRHLLNFHAEFCTFMTPEEIIKENIGKLYEELKSVGFASAPGSEFRYANAHSILLGLLLEHLFGECLEVLFQKHLFGPLGLKNTITSPNGMLDRVLPSHHGLPIGVIHDPVARMALQESRLIGSAGLFSSAIDLMKVVSLVSTRGYVNRGDANAFIYPFWIDRLHMSENAKNNFATGMGHWVNLRRKLEEHNPTDPGKGLFKSGWTGSFVAAFTDLNASIVLTSDFLNIPRNPGELTRAKELRNILHLRLGEVAIQTAMSS